LDRFIKIYSISSLLIAPKTKKLFLEEKVMRFLGMLVVSLLAAIALVLFLELYAYITIIAAIPELSVHLGEFFRGFFSGEFFRNAYLIFIAAWVFLFLLFLGIRVAVGARRKNKSG